MSRDIRLKVMSYNIRHGRGMDERYDLQRIAGVLRDSSADIIGLQEVDRHYADRSRYEDTISELAQNLGMFYRYGANVVLPPEEGRTKQREYGIAVLSKYPIVSSGYHPLNSFDDEQRGLLSAEIVVNGASLHFHCVHLALEEHHRIAQVEEMAGIADAKDGPCVIVGDFNAHPEGPEIERMEQRCTNVFSGAHAAYTFPSDDPAETLDYIFIHHGLEYRGEREIIQSAASDHCPIAAYVYLNGR
ncbi:endonuclease/exonuclease/phosphatase family protein [Paenibacillus sp. DMB20]|uniref:endonuclease/exonuclease/phosphatase family protein n=1 Tax=Paenibacillus sp. DMB20 TaxID=1642570 RepID=UPI000627AE42|nr:endonuclease/exonuclease/phosphatase family protein [Paenibacillus sp. DMB20]KKO53089.1 endonuclease [Paenibacillus sp. DMB20]